MQAVSPELPRSDWPIDIQLKDLSTAQDSAVDVQLIIGQLYLGAKNNREFIKAGGIGIILAVMKRHERRANIQEQGCRVLAEIAHSLPAYGTMVLSLAEDATVVQVILSCMWHHEDKVGVQEQGCRALAELAAKLSWRRYLVWAREIVDASFIDAILSAMRQHEHIASVQEEACRVLNFFASNEDIAYLMDAGGALDVISAALRNHPDNSRIKVSASAALLHLARMDGNRYLIGAVDFNNLLSDAWNDGRGGDDEILDQIGVRAAIEDIWPIIQNGVDMFEAQRILDILARNHEKIYKKAAARGMNPMLTVIQNAPKAEPMPRYALAF